MTSETKPHSSKPYRPCVGIALFNAAGQVFVGERIDTQGAWQMPQGGIDAGEDIKSAAYRELEEETGITQNSADFIRICAAPIRYDLPDHLQNKLWGGRFAGQEQIWTALRFTGQDSEVNLNAFNAPEFSQWQWVDLDKTLELIVPFKREIYSQVIAMFRDIRAID